MFLKKKKLIKFSKFFLDCEKIKDNRKVLRNVFLDDLIDDIAVFKNHLNGFVAGQRSVIKIFTDTNSHKKKKLFSEYLIFIIV